MVNDVESILNEIRERVRADNGPGGLTITPVQDERDKDSLARTNAPNGFGNDESLSRMSAHLTTTARAWDRLPPMYSNRRGSAARLELWIKARLKSLSRWFTWEQVNFNSAVHHALAETLHALSAHQQELARTRAELRNEAEHSREKLELRDRELRALRASVEALTAELRQRDANQEARVREIGAAMTNDLDAARRETAARLGELREIDQQLREEQRVCFKQLSLEASEASVAADRGRRVIETRLEKLENSVSNGEQ